MSTDLRPWYEARELMVEALVKDLIGDVTEEILEEEPLNRFLAGILYPNEVGELMDSVVETDDGETVEGDAAEDSGAPGVNLSRVRLPSSMGITFRVPEFCREIEVSVSAARFEPTADDDLGTSDREIDPPGRSSAERRKKWYRVPISLGWTRFTTDQRLEEVDVESGLRLNVYVRPPFSGARAITVTLVNLREHDASRRDLKDASSYFQTHIAVRIAEGLAIHSLDRYGDWSDTDRRSDELLYRDVHTYAVGHGCAVEWNDSSPPTEVRTVHVPRHELLLAEPSGGSPRIDLGMERLARGEGIDDLRGLVKEYCDWIDLKSIDADALTGKLAETAHKHLDAAREAAVRIDLGITLLEEDPQVRRAFMLMNEAMNEQRMHQELARARAAGIEPRLGRQKWRTFQIAFILLNLPGLADPEHDDREIVDLLWFPTGGGKTEAYLGAVGFVVLLRRLRNQLHGGVSVLMRYTLRLLTIQQFERAAGLICALELIRRRELPSTRPISIGLWVGQGATPNNVRDANVALKALRRGDPIDKGNPMQLLSCPWCSSELSVDDYHVGSDAVGLTITCPNSECEFANGIPAYVLDEDIYRERPSLVIGTVDKFAMMAWRENVAALFGRVHGDPTPDLIVQDELHLISGPLGTMVGLYETAVDAASTGVGRPKVVASTATIRRATEQVKAVFDRDARQFPPPALEPDDSWFARQASRDEKGSRMYVGVLAPGVSQTTLMVRVYAALLQTAKDLDVSKEVRDTYWTMVGYFNSLRLLGGAYLQVIDDVPDRLNLLGRASGSPRKLTDEPTELTSRVSSRDIPGALASLSRGYGDARAVDVVLATNMISVGLDVDRLGLMTVMGQPQLTAEYIQATSRVGRRFPGLVVTIYNGTRSRDKSHYETFGTYHSTLYRGVEATGATPFSPRARDRGLHGVLVSAARLLHEGLRGERAARSAFDHEDELRRVGELILDRCDRVAPDGVIGTEQQIEDLVEYWLAASEDERNGVSSYSGWRRETDRLLWPVDADSETGRTVTFPPAEPPWPTMTSLRDVDVESKIVERHIRRSDRRLRR